MHLQTTPLSYIIYQYVCAYVCEGHLSLEVFVAQAPSRMCIVRAPHAWQTGDTSCCPSAARQHGRDDAARLDGCGRSLRRDRGCQAVLLQLEAVLLRHRLPGGGDHSGAHRVCLHCDLVRLLPWNRAHRRADRANAVLKRVPASDTTLGAFTFMQPSRCKQGMHGALVGRPARLHIVVVEKNLPVLVMLHFLLPILLGLGLRSSNSRRAPTLPFPLPSATVAAATLLLHADRACCGWHRRDG